MIGIGHTREQGRAAGQPGGLDSQGVSTQADREPASSGRRSGASAGVNPPSGPTARITDRSARDRRPLATAEFRAGPPGT